MSDHPTGTREIIAAIVREQGTFELGPVLMASARPDEVVVRIVATGLCHTDLVVRDQVYPMPLPVVLGDEGPGSWRRSVVPSPRSSPVTTWA
jgi:aryl-alcohol dehydrogenase